MKAKIKYLLTFLTVNNFFACNKKLIHDEGEKNLTYPVSNQCIELSEILIVFDVGKSCGYSIENAIKFPMFTFYVINGLTD